MPVPPVTPRVAWPVEDIGVLPLRAEIIDPQAVVVIPRDEVKIRRAGEVLRRSFVSGVVEIVIGRSGVIVVPAPQQDTDSRPPEEGTGVHDTVHRLTEGIRVESLLAASETDAIYRPDKAGEVVVGVRRRVVLVGPEPVGALRGSRDEVLAPAVIAVRPGPVGESRAPDIAAADLVEVAVVVRTEMIPQESPVNLLNDREMLPLVATSASPIRISGMSGSSGHQFLGVGGDMPPRMPGRAVPWRWPAPGLARFCCSAVHWLNC